VSLETLELIFFPLPRSFTIDFYNLLQNCSEICWLSTASLFKTVPVILEGKPTTLFPSKHQENWHRVPPTDKPAEALHGSTLAPAAPGLEDIFVRMPPTQQLTEARPPRGDVWLAARSRAGRPRPVRLSALFILYTSWSVRFSHLYLILSHSFILYIILYPLYPLCDSLVTLSKYIHVWSSFEGFIETNLMV
jgi:hypothetical protein